ncbi:NAD(P)-binding protein [Diplogelasinospora grovesii]|uniref:NAD(P)-binding protein n=1 Tax=Diplogelasinospora grovesii TaxID=303347 RepID=A0AAN6S5Y7_9PEZI|nr:NAD(P)-binding protein [Diplogelasinospora grovesii]
MSTVVVFGATGAQGGSVVNRLLKNPKYKVRAVTRKVNSESAKKLASQGVEVVAGDMNDAESMKHVFKGAEAAFVVTAFWPSIMSLGITGAGDEELQQLKNLALAAQSTPTLKHYVLSTLPACEVMSGGKFKVPHFDYKQRAVAWMKEHTPDLWAKTTEFWPGWYTSNLANFATMKFFEIPGSYGGYLLALPSKPDAILPIAGNLEHNCGVIVEGILNSGPAVFGKVVPLITDYLKLTDVCGVFEKVTGKRAGYAEMSDESAAKIFGDFGTETAAQLRWGEEYSYWDQFEPERTVTFEQLGVEKDIIGFEAALTAIKDKVV